ncbi:unnamed protein product, partial [Musa acuminata subsp. burmannicoides]
MSGHQSARHHPLRIGKQSIEERRQSIWASYLCISICNLPSPWRYNLNQGSQYRTVPIFRPGLGTGTV